MRFLFAAIQCDEEDITSYRPKAGCCTAWWVVCFDPCSGVGLAICVWPGTEFLLNEGGGLKRISPVSTFWVYRLLSVNCAMWLTPGLSSSI
jgi:hypothetical protein